MPERSYLSIGEVLSLLQPEFPDLTISKIRFLESQGLLDPERTPSGYRKFYDQDIERLRWILRQQREQYLPLKVIKGRLTGGPEDDDVVHHTDVAVAVAEHEVEHHTTPRELEAEPRRNSGAEPPVRDVEAAPAPAPAAPDIDDVPNPLQAGRSGVHLTMAELSEATGLAPDDITELQRFGLLAGKAVGGTAFYDEEALIVAKLAAGFMRHGVEARHLRMYKTAAEREAGFFEQLVMPMLKQRNPRSRKQAMDTLVELGKLGHAMRAAMLRQALKSHTSAG